MRKGQIFFILMGFASLMLQASCANKIASVSGVSGLHAEREGRGGSISSIKEEEIEEEGMAFTPDGRAGIGEGTIGEEGVSKKPILVKPGGSEMTATLVDVFFDYNKASLKSDSKVVLQENARNLILHPTVHIQLAGHTDNRGSNEYNLALGARRARAVKRFLEALGVSPHRMEVISYGEESPFCKESQKSCWQLNRRVHFIAQPEG